MRTLGDLVARDRRRRAPALRAPAVDRAYSWHDWCTDAQKAGNVLRYLGVREGSLVAVAPEPTPEPVLAFLGAAQLGAVTRFAVDPLAGARVVLVPRDREGEVAVEPGTKLAAYGGAPADPSTTHWEKELWSENPRVHPAEVSPDDPALTTAGASAGAGENESESGGEDDGSDDPTTYSHADLLSAARAAVDDLGLTDDDRVAVRGSLAHPGVVAGGVVAPLLAGGCVVLDPGATAYDAAVVGPGPSPGDEGDREVPEPASRRVVAAGLL